MPAPSALADLVARFAEHVEDYKNGTYNETQLRKDYLDPFFKLLGWDMDNAAGYAEAYRDVIHEDQVRVKGALKAPDYGFRIGGNRKFFMEAKKPSVKIKDDASPAYQLRRYAWSAKLPLSILSDFEEFAIYDTRHKPKPGDPASKGRIFYCRFDEYEKHWDFIAGIFSIESIRKGSFDKYAATAKGKRGTTEVDKDFLSTIEGWRADLARNLALRNPALSQRELNFSVQRVLDRIIFLRICEDRGIEDYERLKKTTDSKGIYQALVTLFQQADDRYNSGLFHFRKEKSRHEDHDTLTPHLVIDDALLKPLIRGLYYPESPYEFSVFTADILGQVYEQFLGKVITLSAGHRASVEEKPEVKKAGGVYYTPTYIVDYIVQQTVGPLIEGKSPKQIENIRVLDPACGSGSFLIGCYQFLLDWYLDYYITHDPEKHSKGKSPAIVAASGGGWALTTTERKRILLAHIYGVDIDSQAVEVTKLSLLLKVLEGETAQSVQRELIQERVLPDLGDNIKCGNSLIGSDFYAQAGLPEMDTDAHLRINVFDWDGKDGFPEIMKSGGFDAVVGNPPYVRVQLVDHQQTDYLFRNYKCASSKIDLSVFFLERSLKLVSKNGVVGLITTKQWISTDYGLNIRLLLSKGLLHRMIDFGSLPVFANADTYPAILICSNKTVKEFKYGLVADRDMLNPEGISQLVLQTISFSTLSSQAWNLSGFDLKGICASRQIRVKPLSNYGHVFIGDLTGFDEAFVLRKEECDANEFQSGLLLPYAYRGSEVARYCNVLPQSCVIYPYDERPDGGSVLIDEEDFARRAPTLHARLLVHIKKLKQRMDSRKLYAAQQWYRHLRPGSYSYIRPKKLIFKGIDIRLSVGLLDENCVFNGANTPAFIPENLGETSLLYLLGILNSKLIGFYLVRVCPPKLGGYTRFNSTNINDTPIRFIDTKSKSDVAAHDRIVALVEKMLTLHPQRAAAKTPHEQTALDRQIAATDAQIDREVYALYGLSEEEIKLVEA